MTMIHSWCSGAHQWDTKARGVFSKRELAFGYIHAFQREEFLYMDPTGRGFGSVVQKVPGSIKLVDPIGMLCR